jgi:hypothetical protein
MGALPFLKFKKIFKIHFNSRGECGFSPLGLSSYYWGLGEFVKGSWGPRV